MRKQKLRGLLRVKLVSSRIWTWIKVLTQLYSIRSSYLEDAKSRQPFLAGLGDIGKLLLFQDLVHIHSCRGQVREHSEPIIVYGSLSLLDLSSLTVGSDTTHPHVSPRFSTRTNWDHAGQMLAEWMRWHLSKVLKGKITSEQVDTGEKYGGGRKQVSKGKELGPRKKASNLKIVTGYA